MTRTDKARRVQAILDELYPTAPVPLDHDDPFTLLVAVLLSAQTTDVRVNLVTPALFAEAPDSATMARLGRDRILHHIRSCGLSPSKAKNIAALAQLLEDDYGGVVPADIEALERLPGVGHKTASVVMSQAFGVPAFPVDTHIHRLAARWGLSNGRNVVQTERDLTKLYPSEAWNLLHLQIIYFGREHCPARGHDLANCPICGWAATKKQIRAEQPAAKSRPKSKG
ncbi:MAG: endonuclease III [bacterium]